MASQTAVTEILEIASRYRKAKWLVVSADPEVSAALARSGAKMAAKPTEASGIILVDTLHQLSPEELTTLAAFLHEGRPFLVSVPNRTHGSLRLAALASQPGNDAAMHLDAVVSTLQSCGLDISEIAAVEADVLDSETALDVTGLPSSVFDWLRNQLGATEQRFVVLGIRTDSADRQPVPAVRPLGSYVRPSSEDDARTLVSERERQAVERAEGAEGRVRELEAEAERLAGQIRSLHEAAEAQRKDFVGQVEQIRAELEERARKAIEQGVQESNFTRKAELKAAAKTEKKLRAELEKAQARIAELMAARGAAAGLEAAESAEAEAAELAEASVVLEDDAASETTDTVEAPAGSEADAAAKPAEIAEVAEPAEIAEPSESAEIAEPSEDARAASSEREAAEEQDARGDEAEFEAQAPAEAEMRGESEAPAAPESEAPSEAEVQPESPAAQPASTPMPEPQKAPEPQPEQQTQRRSRLGRLFGRR